MAAAHIITVLMEIIFFKQPIIFLLRYGVYKPSVGPHIKDLSVDSLKILTQVPGSGVK